MTILAKPVCEECGNDGTKARLYVTIDASYDAKANAWILEEREDEGGGELDCLECDHRTDAPPFPYEVTVPHAAAPDLFAVMIGYGDNPAGHIVPGTYTDFDAAQAEANSRANAPGRWACVYQIAARGVPVQHQEG